MIRFKKEDALMIKGGHTALLLKRLEEADDTVIRGMKNMKDFGDMRYHQGASAVIDSLIKLLK